MFELSLAELPNKRRLTDVAIACDDYLQDGDAAQRLLVATEEVFMRKYELIRINGLFAEQGSVGSLKKQM